MGNEGPNINPFKKLREALEAEGKGYPIERHLLHTDPTTIRERIHRLRLQRASQTDAESIKEIDTEIEEYEKRLGRIT